MCGEMGSYNRQDRDYFKEGSCKRGSSYNWRLRRFFWDIIDVFASALLFFVGGGFAVVFCEVV